MSDNRVSQFEKDITAVINLHSEENGSNTPDFILAAYLNDCLATFNRAVKWKALWYSKDGVPEDLRHLGPPAGMRMPSEKNDAK